MSKFIISEGVPLKGKVKISGAKNSALPILAATILAEGQSILEDIPDLNDVKIMGDLLRSLGVYVEQSKDGTFKVNSSKVYGTTAPYDLVTKMRASFLIMGPLLSRLGQAKISLPGGCAIGTRPVDLHLKGFNAMGAKISQQGGYIEVKAKKLKGAKIYLDFPSVGATENILMAASLAEGHTVIENAAIEPEIVDLANFLVVLGADIKGAGTDTIKINGVKELKGANHCIIPDRIEAGTFMVAAAITGGDVEIENVVPDHLKPVTAKLKETGVEVAEDLCNLRVIGKNKFKSVDVKTLPYPGFPTDMQAQFTSLMAVGEGTSIIIETIFENRFMHISELKRMGANIKIDGRSAVIEGSRHLAGAQVKATDLRAGAALVLAGVAARGRTEIIDIEHVDRGYYKIDEKLKALGANITRIDEEMSKGALSGE